jgi:hypothetical protein
MTARPWPARARLCLLLAGLACAGCGLGEYEAKMLAEQQRLERFDRDNRLLGDPVSAPAAWARATSSIPELFLRLPRGVRPAPDENPWNDPLFHYPGDGRPFDRVFLAWGGGKDLRADVEKLYAAAKKSPLTATTTPLPGAPALTLTGFAAEEAPERDGRQFVSYVYFDPTGRLAVVYRVDRGRLGQGVTDAIQASLDGLVLGAEAGPLRAEVDRRSEGAGR